MSNFCNTLLYKLSGQSILASGVALGILVPFLADLAYPFLYTSVFVFVVGSFVRMDLGVFGMTVLKPKVSLGLPLICMIVMPSALWFLAGLSGLSLALCIGILMYAASPPSTGNAAMAKMFDYHGELPMTVIVVATLMTPITLPLLIGSLSDRSIEWVALATSLFKFLGAAAVVAAVLRWTISQSGVENTSTWLDRLVLAALFVFALATMSGVQAKLIADPLNGFSIVLLAYLVNCGLQLMGALLSNGERQERIALGLTMGNRNVGLIWAVAGVGLAPETLLFFAATQLPIFTMPLLIRTVSNVLSR